MAYIATSGFTTFNLGTHLDAQTIQLFALRELFTTPARTVGGTAFSSYTGGDAKFAIDTSYNLTWSGGAYTFNGGSVVFAGTTSALVTGSGGLGFSTGAGGAVTQATSKSTSVTLNKMCGAITMNAASLAAGASVVFQLNNSMIGVGDVIHVNTVGFSLANYRVRAGNAGSGLCAICLENASGGSLAEAVVVWFVVVKATNA